MKVKKPTNPDNPTLLNRLKKVEESMNSLVYLFYKQTEMTEKSEAVLLEKTRLDTILVEKDIEIKTWIEDSAKKRKEDCDRCYG